MASISTAFGYSLYLVPLANNSVDTTFAGISGAFGAGSFNFIDTDNGAVYGTNAAVDYSNGVFTVNGDVFNMDGNDAPVKLLGLNNAALETDTNSESVQTYDDENAGFELNLPTGKTWSISLGGVADFGDAGYHLMRLAEQNTVADALRVKVVRIGPTGTTEAVYGYGTLTGYTESIEAGSIVEWEATIEGYGRYLTDLDTNVTPATGGLAVGSPSTSVLAGSIQTFTSLTDGSGVAITLSGGGATGSAEVSGCLLYTSPSPRD